MRSLKLNSCILSLKKFYALVILHILKKTIMKLLCNCTINTDHIGVIKDYKNN